MSRAVTGKLLFGSSSVPTPAVVCRSFFSLRYSRSFLRDSRSFLRDSRSFFLAMAADFLSAALPDASFELLLAITIPMDGCVSTTATFVHPPTPTASPGAASTSGSTSFGGISLRSEGVSLFNSLRELNALDTLTSPSLPWVGAGRVIVLELLLPHCVGSVSELLLGVSEGEGDG